MTNTGGRYGAGQVGPWQRHLLSLLAVGLALLTASASVYAQPAAKRPGCLHSCWARAFVEGSGGQTFKASTRGDPQGHQDTNEWKNSYQFRLESTTAFVVSDPLVYLNAGLKGKMLFLAYGTEKRVGCTPQRFYQHALGAMDAGLAILSNSAGSQVYLSHDWFGSTYDQEQEMLNNRAYSWSASGYTCGTQEYGGRDSEHAGIHAGFALLSTNLCTLPADSDIVDLSLATLRDNVSSTLPFESECHNNQHNALGRSSFTWHLGATIEITLCPDQSLYKNCALKGHDNLPPKKR